MRAAVLVRYRFLALENGRSAARIGISSSSGGGGCSGTCSNGSSSRSRSRSRCSTSSNRSDRDDVYDYYFSYDVHNCLCYQHYQPRTSHSEVPDPLLL